MKQSNALNHAGRKKVITSLCLACIFSLFAENSFAEEKTDISAIAIFENGGKASINEPAQQNIVKGYVADEQNTALIGVSIIVVGTTQGTVTDVDGSFSIAAQSGATLRFSYLGFETLTVTVKGSEAIRLTMKESLSTLDEIVVVGYGVQKKIHMTGSVSQVTNKELLKAPMQNTSNLLTGKISGLTSIQNSGKPGDDGTKLYVRGLNTFKGGHPMVIVDGVPRPMDFINPNDIESISVLKDASAAIYGVQGANGVILITTKSGNENTDAAKISYDGAMIMTENTAMPKFLNAADYMYWHNKASAMDGKTPKWTADIQNKVMSNDPNSIWGQTDWLDKVFRTGWTQQHNISASGGSDRVKYFTSLGVMDQEGTLKNTSYTRYNVRTNLDIKIAKNLRFSTSLSGYRTDRDWPGTAIGNQQEFDPIRQAMTTIPVIKSEYQGLPTAWQATSYLVNGEAALRDSGYKRQNRWQLNSNYKLEYDFSDLIDPLKGLKVSVFGAYDYGQTSDSDFDSYYELYFVNNTFDEGVAGASGFNKNSGYTKSSSWAETYFLRPQIEYSRTFDKHTVSALLLFEKQRTYSNTMTSRKQGYYSPNPVDLSIGTIYPEKSYSGSHRYAGQESWVGRLNYAYGNKYLAEFAFRRDGSYKFAPENRWGFFPSASVGWLASQEEFFSNAFPNISYFKIRASYGQAGSDDLEAYLYNSTFSNVYDNDIKYNNSMILGNQLLSQFYSKNPYIYRDLTWSTTHTANIGFDFDMWNGKLGIELDLFYKLTEDLLEEQDGNYPTSLGKYYPSMQNSGKIDNRGFEITIKHNNRINTDWTYSLKGNFSFARNRVLKKAVADNYPNYRAQLGKSMKARYGYQALGFFQTQEEVDNYPEAPSGSKRIGDLKYRDVNGDGRIEPTKDYVKIGYGEIPEINFSLNLDLTYKDFYVSMLWQGVSRCDYELSGIYDSGVTASTNYTSSFAGNGNSPYYLIEGAWTPENTNAKYPRLSTNANGNNAWRSSWWVVNGEYLRLKNAQIGYSIPPQILKNTPLERVNIYLAGTNLLTFSHFKYTDPESPSVSNGFYPQQKTYSLGLNVTF